MDIIIPLVEGASNVTCYCEPFTGGGAIFHNINLKYSMIINDRFNHLINFYRVLQSRPEELLQKLKETPHSRYIHNVESKNALNSDNDLTRAWGFVVLNNSFNNGFNGTFHASPIDSSPVRWLAVKRKIISMSKRIDYYTIENLDALKCIKKYDRETTLFYIDPPYPGADQGHYAGYTEVDFNNLMEVLKSIKGRFILSCYKSNVKNYMNLFPYHRVVEKYITATDSTKIINRKKKYEFIGWNYRESKTLFDLDQKNT